MSPELRQRINRGYTWWINLAPMNNRDVDYNKLIAACGDLEQSEDCPSAITLARLVAMHPECRTWAIIERFLRVALYGSANVHLDDEHAILAAKPEGRTRINDLCEQADILKREALNTPLARATLELFPQSEPAEGTSR